MCAGIKKDIVDCAGRNPSSMKRAYREDENSDCYRSDNPMKRKTNNRPEFPERGDMGWEDENGRRNL